jgi:Protein of unknown function (DUF2845)
VFSLRALQFGAMKSLKIYVILGMLLAAPAYALRCGNKLVSEGDSRSAVLAKCGEPTEISASSILRRPVFWHGGRPFYVGDGYAQIPVEFWVYNFGPNRLMQRLRFVDGEVEEIESLGYGYNE